MASPRIVAAYRMIPTYLLQSDSRHQDDEDEDENKDEDVDNDSDVGVLKMHLPNLISQSANVMTVKCIRFRSRMRA